MSEGRCIVINKFVVPDGAREAFLAEFAEHRRFLAARPGFRKGALYVKESGPGRFNFVNVAFWESPEALAAARQALGAHYAQAGGSPGDLYARLGVEADLGAYAALEEYGPP
jgi:heme-degrading monooxygenase HmoA